MFLQKSDYNKRKNRSGGIIMAILVTGGAGYIGSHTVVELQNAGYDVVVLDNLSNASEKALDRVSKITGKPVKFYKADILDRDALNDIFDKETIESCIHFAGLKAVGESVVKPWEYYFLFLSNCIWRSGTDSDYRRMPKGTVYESVWLDKIHAGTGAYRYPESRSRMECYASSLL